MSRPLSAGVLSSDPDRADRIAGLLRREPLVGEVVLHDDESSLISAVRGDGHDVLLVSVSEYESNVIGTVGRIDAAPPIAVVADGFDKDAVIDAMASGARYFINLEDGGREIESMIARIAADLEVSVGGRMQLVIPAGGGVGATTFGVELAAASAERGDSTVLVDLDPFFGGPGSMLGLDADFGVSDLVSGADAASMRTTAIGFDDRFAVLLGPAASGGRPLESEAAVTGLLAMIASSWESVVVDAARTPLADLLPSAVVAASVIIVLEPSIDDVRVAVAHRRRLLAAGVDSDRIELVVRERRGMVAVPQSEWSRALGDARVHVLPDETRMVSNAWMKSVPVRDCSRRAKVSRLAGQLVPARVGGGGE
jgi:MinD-like ATPase involved in chromosome partitioning or flagellar assembly